MKSKITQIRKHLKKYKKGITGLDALRLYGLYRLSSTILRLRAEGMNIKTIIEYKQGSSYARYVLVRK